MNRNRKHIVFWATLIQLLYVCIPPVLATNNYSVEEQKFYLSMLHVNNSSFSKLLNITKKNRGKKFFNYDLCVKISKKCKLVFTFDEEFGIEVSHKFLNKLTEESKTTVFNYAEYIKEERFIIIQKEKLDFEGTEPDINQFLLFLKLPKDLPISNPEKNLNSIIHDKEISILSVDVKNRLENFESYIFRMDYNGVIWVYYPKNKNNNLL